MELTKSVFGTCPDGADATLFTLRNKQTGAQVSLTNFGASIVSVKGQIGEVALGFDKLEGYLGTHPYFGSTVGRVANRTAKGKFSLDGRAYELEINNGPNHLHGGSGGFHKRLWRIAGEHIHNDHAEVHFAYTSAAGEEGYPGKMEVEVKYCWTNAALLTFSMTARVDQACPVNLTNHIYWNLAGPGNSILQHTLTLHADRFLPVDETLIPTGEVKKVQDAPCMDFTSPHKIGERIEQTRGGYDHCFIKAPGATVSALVHDASSGRTLEMSSTQPALQFYSGNFLDGIVGAGGVAFPKHSGFCLEPSGYVNAINTPAFPSCVLRPSEIYSYSMSWRFSVKP